MGRIFKSVMPEDTEMKRITPGKYIGKVNKISEGESQSGNPTIVFEIEIRPGFVIKHHCVNSGNNRWMLKKTLHAITGVKPAPGPIEFSADDIEGKQINVNLVEELFNGKTYLKIKDVIVPGNMSEVPVSAEDLVKDFNAGAESVEAEFNF